ncbi:MAG: hypothetical protein OQK77_00435, partial [Psychromonas sp.]|nr:hypothetical protein [Psychromonas sp.]
MKTFLTIILTFFVSFALFGAEADYRDHYAAQIGGEVEVRLSDGSRCDIVTDTHAIEVDYAYKLTEGYGQALLYSSLTGKTPGVLLILEGRQSYDIYIERILRL